MKRDKDRMQLLRQRRLPHACDKIAAGVFDFYTAFYLGGLVIASVKGGSFSNGFNSDGSAAAALVIFIAAYFVIGKCFFQGPIWQRLLAPN